MASIKETLARLREQASGDEWAERKQYQDSREKAEKERARQEEKKKARKKARQERRERERERIREEELKKARRDQQSTTDRIMSALDTAMDAGGSQSSAIDQVVGTRGTTSAQAINRDNDAAAEEFLLGVDADGNGSVESDELFQLETDSQVDPALVAAFQGGEQSETRQQQPQSQQQSRSRSRQSSQSQSESQSLDDGLDDLLF